jgi:hypothetical protein
MPLDLGNNPVFNPPTNEESQQIKNVLGLGNVENIAITTSQNIKIGIVML